MVAAHQLTLLPVPRPTRATYKRILWYVRRLTYADRLVSGSFRVEWRPVDAKGVSRYLVYYGARLVRVVKIDSGPNYGGYSTRTLRQRQRELAKYLAKAEFDPVRAKVAEALVFAEV